MRYVLDVCAIISLVKNEDGELIVRQALESENNVSFMAYALVEISTFSAIAMRAQALRPCENVDMKR
ncbi:MAG TPA: hypothetical protein HPP94_07900 [Desulfuromonadales bacterium]|nr:hypothetical protein [Desulfuromonadales bacterium]